MRKVARRTGLSAPTVRRILHKDLVLSPFKLRLTQKLKRGDKAKRLAFCTWLRGKLSGRPRWLDGVYMSDEAHFYLDGQVNKQNCRIWAAENPHAGVEHEVQTPHVTVWSAISAKRLIGPFFFEEAGAAATVTASRYKAMLEDFFFPALKRGVPQSALSRLWF